MQFDTVLSRLVKMAIPTVHNINQTVKLKTSTARDKVLMISQTCYFCSRLFK